MKLSTRGRYGLRAVYFLAENVNNGYVSVSQIAKELSLSENYLEQLIRILKKENIIESTRGAKGGYRLKYSPEEITVGKILRALEGEFTTASCVENAGDCIGNECKAREVFVKMDKALNKAADSITLSDMLKD